MSILCALGLATCISSQGVDFDEGTAGRVYNNCIESKYIESKISLWMELSKRDYTENKEDPITREIARQTAIRLIWKDLSKQGLVFKKTTSSSSTLQKYADIQHSCRIFIDDYHRLKPDDWVSITKEEIEKAVKEFEDFMR